jgi:phosphoserine phosphatase
MRQYFLYLILFFHAPLIAYVNQHNNFDAICNYISLDDHHSGTIILLDLDNTLVQPYGTYLASDQWVEYHIKQKMNDGLSAREAWLLIKDLYIHLQQYINLTLVEEIAVQIIKELQSKGIIVIAITARLSEVSNNTLMQLHNLGIHFSQLWHEELSDHDLRYHYRDGIIFCDGNDKGKAFEHITHRINKYFKKIIAVDDKEKNLHSIKKVLHPDIDFIGIRYNYLDTIVAAFDHEQAELDLQKYLVTIQ